MAIPDPRQDYWDAGGHHPSSQTTPQRQTITIGSAKAAIDLAIQTLRRANYEMSYHSTTTPLCAGNNVLGKLLHDIGKDICRMAFDSNLSSEDDRRSPPQANIHYTFVFIIEATAGRMMDMLKCSDATVVTHLYDLASVVSVHAMRIFESGIMRTNPDAMKVRALIDSLETEVKNFASSTKLYIDRHAAASSSSTPK